MIKARRLSKQDSDYEPLHTAMAFKEAQPEWMNAIEAMAGLQVDEDLWATADNPGLINIGFFEDENIVSLLTFRHTGAGCFEAHLISKRGFSLDKLADIAWEWGWGLFENLNARMIYAWIPERNRASKRAANFLCLTYDGVVRWHGLYNGKIVKWYRHTLYREIWEGWQTDGRQQNEAGGRGQEERDLPAEPEGTPAWQASQ